MTGPRFAPALAAILLAAATVVATQSLAQDYPTRPIKIIVPFGAGGPADVTARLIGNVWDPLESTCRHASLSIL